MPWVCSRYLGIALALVGMSGKYAGAGVHGSVITGPSIGVVLFIGIGFPPPLIGLPLTPGVRILWNPLTHPRMTVEEVFPSLPVCVSSPFRSPSTDSHVRTTIPLPTFTSVNTNWSGRGTTVAWRRAAAAA